jgi:hypothetical protein
MYKLLRLHQGNFKITRHTHIFNPFKLYSSRKLHFNGFLQSIEEAIVSSAAAELDSKSRLLASTIGTISLNGIDLAPLD